MCIGFAEIFELMEEINYLCSEEIHKQLHLIPLHSTLPE